MLNVHLDSKVLFPVRKECESSLVSFQESVTIQRDETKTSSSRNPSEQLRKHSIRADAESVDERQHSTYQADAANRWDIHFIASL